jgi:hypothetical protein
LGQNFHDLAPSNIAAVPSSPSPSFLILASSVHLFFLRISPQGNRQKER